MPRQIVRFLVLIPLLYCTGTTYAEGILVRGVGTFSCGKYLQLRGTGDATHDLAVVSWVWGYIAGFNMEAHQPATRETPDAPSTLAFIDKYCKDHPLDSVVIATNVLLQELGGLRNPR